MLTVRDADLESELIKQLDWRLSGIWPYVVSADPSLIEQKIPLVDAERLLELCEPGAIDKVRYLVPRGSHTWEVDVFHGANEGLILAEIELSSEDELFEKPAWLGKEVSGDRCYYNSMLTKHPFNSSNT